MDGIRFTCQQGCTKCCDVKGYVYLTEQDIEHAARFLNMPVAEFEARYIVRYRQLRRLRKPPRKQCHFLMETGCSIHPAKPTQCRLYPYWPELVEDRSA